MIARLGRMSAGLGLEMVLLKVRIAATADAPSARSYCASSTPPAVASSPRSTSRRPSRCSRSTRAPSGSCPRAVAGWCTRPRSSSVLAPSAARPALRSRPGEFVEHDLDDSGQLVAVDRARARRTRRRSSSGWSRNRTERYPEGMLRVILLGDPTRSLGSLAEAECRRVIAALDLAEQPRGAVRVVRAFGRRQDRDGLRHREHGLGRGRATADRRASPRPVARSTSSSAGSTSAPSRTGTPRRRC